MNTPTISTSRILAVDPGYDRLGLAVLEGNPSHPTLVWSTCVVPPPGDHEKRLAHIAQVVTSAVQEYTPHYVALETLFFGINKKTALGVAESRGVILAIAGSASLPVIECTPQQVKIAVTGYGKSSKDAVSRMVSKLVTLPHRNRLDDEIDAIAVGITALAMRPLPR